VGVRYLSRSPTEAPDAGDTYNITAALATSNHIFKPDGVTPLIDGRFLSSTNQWYMTAPSAVVVDVGVHYSLRTDYHLKLNHSIALNVSNALDHIYVTKGRMLAEGRAIVFSYTLSH
jgi:hypothetical protein